MRTAGTDPGQPLAFETTLEVETLSIKQTGFSVLENYEPTQLVTWYCETAAPKCLPRCLFYNPFVMISSNGTFTNDPDYPTQNELWVGDVVTPKAVRDDPSMRPQSPVRLFDDGTPSLAERTLRRRESRLTRTTTRTAAVALRFTVSRRWMRSSPLCGATPKRLDSRSTSALIALLGPTKVRTTSWRRKGLEPHQRSAEARVRFPVTVPQRWIHLGLHAVSRRGGR